MSISEQRPIVVIENGVKTVHAFNFTLDQEQTGYAIPKLNQPLAQAPYDLALYVDTLTIKGPVTMPGRNLTIVARQIELAHGAIINVSGHDPDITFKPGHPAGQTDTELGSDGTSGSDGGAGNKGGDVTIFADTITDIAKSAVGKPHITRFGFRGNMAEQVEQSLKDLSKKFTQLTVKVTDIPFSETAMLFAKNSGKVSLKNVVFKGFDKLSVDSCVFNTHNQRWLIGLTASHCQFAGDMGFLLNEPKVDNVPDSHVKCDDFSIKFHLAVDLAMADWETIIHSFGMSLINFSPVRVGSYEQMELVFFDSLVADIYKKYLHDSLIAGLKKEFQVLLYDVLAQANGGFPFKHEKVDLLIVAQGGVGGRGQDGHDGMKGKMGDRGADHKGTVGDIYGFNNQAPKDTYGKAGHQGGAAGSAGHSGTGGTGGEIDIRFMEAAPLHILLSSEGGAGGPSANPGNRGAGGDGGHGGKYTYSKGMYMGTAEATGPTGNPGPKGDAAKFGGATGEDGKNTTILINQQNYTANQIAKLSYIDLAPLYDLDQLLIIQRQAKFEFLNGKTQQQFNFVATLYNWLGYITRPYAENIQAIEKGMSGTDTPPSLSPSAEVPKEDVAVRQSIYEVSLVQMMHLQQGLDFYGHTYNWVPGLRLEHLIDRTQQLFTLGRMIEDQANAYQDEQADKEAKIKALGNALDGLSDKIDDSMANDEIIIRQMESVDSTISSLAVTIERQTAIVADYKSDLDRAIEARAAECDFWTALSVLQTIVSVGMGVASGIGALKEAATIGKTLSAEGKSFKQILDDKNMVKEIKKIKGAIKDIQEGYKDVKEWLTDDRPDTAKLIVDLNEFDKNIQPLLDDFPQAGVLQDAVHLLMSTVQDRNHKLMEYTALKVKQLELQTNARQLHREVNRVSVLKSQYQTTLVPTAYLNFFQSAVTSSREVLVKRIYEENRAFSYHSSRFDSFAISDINVGTLATYQNDLLNRYDEFLNTMGRPYSPINAVKVTLDRDNNPASFKALADSGRFAFNLDIDHPAFAGKSLVKIDRVEIYLPDVDVDSGILDLAILLNGVGDVRSPEKDNEVVRFNCSSRSVNFEYKYGASENETAIQTAALIADKNFAPMSPFGQWTIDFGLEDNLNSFVDLTALSRIEILFFGHAFGRKVAWQREHPKRSFL